MSKTPGFLAAIAFTVGLAVLCGDCQRSVAQEFLVPESQAFRAGLKVQWDTQLPIGGPFKLVDWFLQIDENSSTTYFVLEAGTVRELVSNRQLNPQGEPFGLQGAQEEIQFRKELLATRMKMRGIDDVEIKVSSYTLPKSVLYALSSDGVVTAIDADTGDILWDQLIGSIDLNVVGLGASNNHVAVIVGSKVYCLNSKDGRTLWSKETVFAPSASPAVSDSNILVPLGNGRLQSFRIEDEGYGSNAFFASGFATARPLVSGNRVAWTTDSGQLNLATPAVSKAVSFRIKANDAIVATPTSVGNRVFAASLDGFVYCVDQEQGRLLWEVTTGSGITQSPVPIGNFLYVVSLANQLFKIETESGRFSENWDTPIEGISHFLSATTKSIFALDAKNHLQVIDKSSGKLTGSVSIGTIDLVLTNYQTDRIYLATSTGLIECVREITSETPVFHNRDQANATPAQPGDAGPEVDPFAVDRDNDPFAAGEDDPFATPADDSDPGSTPGPDDDDDDGNPFN